MNAATKPLLAMFAVGSLLALSAASAEWLAAIQPEHRDTLSKRLDVYVKANHSRDWNKLFDFISEAARGGVDRPAFVTRMKTAHQRAFSNRADLLEFRPSRSSKSGSSEYDVYGCGKAQREGQYFNGVALIHAVFEHNDWFFSGWSFTEFPNEPCKALSDPSWEMPERMQWDQPMEELRNAGGVPFHVD